ncbi:hypothetical protein VNO77_30762 [Canavalia gladiata]|uniref:Uncharacterized protein n=1 Tax=Canavalia gladiata TaxID=3824 RepID=A0AAN9Q1I2_CANGL
MKLRCRIDRPRRTPIAVRRVSPARKACGFRRNERRRRRRNARESQSHRHGSWKGNHCYQSSYYYPE